MDRKYYYRLLGLQEDATSGQITKAFESKIARLKSADYADDPDYVQRKIAEVKYAYSVIMGTAPPESRVQRERRFEKYKDHVENGCFDQKSCDVFKKKKNKVEASFSAARARNKMDGLKKKVSGTKEGKTFAGVTIAVIISLMGSLISACDDMFFYEGPVFSVDYESQNEALYQAQVDRIILRDMEYDYYGFLDGSEPAPADKIEWEITEQQYDALWSCCLDLCSSLDLYSLEASVNYWTGDDDFYWNNDDYQISLVLGQMMGAPAFEEIAGFRDIYSDQYIVDYTGYMTFLTEVAIDQTDQICGEPVEYIE